MLYNLTIHKRQETNIIGHYIVGVAMCQLSSSHNLHTRIVHQHWHVRFSSLVHEMNFTLWKILRTIQLFIYMFWQIIYWLEIHLSFIALTVTVPCKLWCQTRLSVFCPRILFAKRKHPLYRSLCMLGSWHNTNCSRLKYISMNSKNI